MATEPKILTKNYVQSDDTITASSGQTSVGALYNRDPQSRYMSSGADSDATQVTIEVDFYESGIVQNRTIDTLILQNHNLKDWNFDYWNGTIWVTLITATGDMATDEYRTFSAVITTAVRIQATATQTPNQEKAIGEMIVNALLLDVGQDMMDYSIQFREYMALQRLGDGSYRKIVKRWTPNRIEKYEAAIGWKVMNLSTVNLLYTVKETNLPFYWYPESISRPDQIYYVHWTSPFKAAYSAMVKSAGWNINIDLKEV
jgi:hypothetical protein